MKCRSLWLAGIVALTACQGPQGPQGAQGPAGATGPQGAQGNPGPPGTFTGTFLGDAGVVGNLDVTGSITSPESWVLLHSVTLASAADYTISGLDGDAWSRFRIEAEGTIFVGGGDKAIGIRPNNDTNGANYVMVMSYDQHSPGSSATTGVTGGYGVTNGAQLPLCAGNFNTDCQLFCTGEMRTRTGNFRQLESNAVATTINSACASGNIGCTTRQRHGGTWRNTTANITSLTLFFNTATGFNGNIRLYGRK